MEIGDYVRTRDGFDRLVSIRKDDNYDYNWYGFGEGRTMTNPENDFVIKSSPNIIDLIEVGDFITYKKGNMYIDIPYRVYGTYNEILEETELRIDDEYLKDIEILSIVTKEQFESMEYKVGEQ